MSLHPRMDAELRLEDKLRKKAVAHYDCRSMTVDFNCPSRYRILHQRRNTTTGASAASLVAAHQQQLLQQQHSNNANGNDSFNSNGTNGNGKSYSNNISTTTTNNKDSITPNNTNGNHHTPNQLQTQSSTESNNSNSQNTPNEDDLSLFQGPPDYGDGRENDIVANCPFFRNELGGEKERIICLNRLTMSRPQTSDSQSHRPSFVCGISVVERTTTTATSNTDIRPCNTPNFPRTCPYQRLLSDDNCFAIDHVDTGATYYRDYFHGRDHQNWLGKSENYGPLAISIRKERSPTPRATLSQATTNHNGNYRDSHQHYYSTQSLSQYQAPPVNPLYAHGQIQLYGGHHYNGGFNAYAQAVDMNRTRDNTSSSSSCGQVNNQITNVQQNNGTSTKFQYRIIIRTSELAVLRGTVYEDCIPTLTSSSSRNSHSNHQQTTNHNAKEVLEYLLANTDIQVPKLRLGMPTAEDQLLKLDEHKLTKNYKVGVLYCKAGQSTEEEFYNNEHSGPLFEEFLECLGESVRLKGFDRYRAGLDNRTDTTGHYSVYANYSDCEIMFHVSTLLPYQPNNRQQLLRKRHIGNNIVTIVFQEEGALPFSPKTIRSQFQHVFIIVRALSPPLMPDGTVDISIPRRYSVAVSRSKEMPPFGPPIPEGGTFVKSKLFTNFILAKIINAENAAHKYCEKFATMAQRTRLGLLMDLAEHYATTTTLDHVCGSTSTGVKLVSSLFKKRSARRYTNFCGGAAIQGAIVWDVLVEDFGQSKNIDCFIGISSAYLVIVEEQSKETIYAAPVEAILGWTSHPSWIRIFCHQGECLFLRCKDPDVDEMVEIVERLKAVSNGCETRELILRRKSSTASLGFDIQPEGIVTNVEPRSIAWQSGLSPGSRVVEICKAATATLDYPLIMDLIKTSIVVTITVLPPNPDGSPRIGCVGFACAHQAARQRPASTFSSASANALFLKPRRRGTNLITLV